MKSNSVAAGVENSGRDVSKSEANRPQLSNVPSIEEIQQRAYEIHIERGGTHGQDEDDWLKAERELGKVSGRLRGSIGGVAELFLRDRR
jgi:hypothetical protein